jgi:hypothetical protein
MVTGCILVLTVGLFASTASGQAGGQPSTQPGVTQTPARDTSQKTGTARIRGRVAAADTGQPLRKAQVRATSSELKENRLATTDGNGVYELVDLPAGRYQLTAMKGSFVQLQYGQTRPFEAGKPLQVTDGQLVEHVDFNLPRGALVTGRIVDEFGEPVTDVQVTALRYRYVSGRRQLGPIGRVVMTNDIGEYRLFGLAPGQYFLSATLRAANSADVSTDRSGYAPTYYPGTASLADAQRLTIGVGQTMNEVNLVLVPARLARVSGTAVDSDGKPLPGGLVGMVLANSGAGLAGLAITQMRPDGSFALSNVAPGEYTIRAVVPQTALPPGTSQELISARITVEGDDISGFRLAGVKSSNVSGKVVFDQASTDKTPATALQLTMVPEIPDPLGPGGLAKVNDDLTFDARVQPGRHFVRLGAQSKDVMLKAVRLNGDDVTDTGVEFRAAEDVAGLEVELTRQIGQLAGTATDEQGKPTKEYSVIVFPRASDHWTIPASRYFGNSRPDQDGRFLVRGLPAGEYYAIALDYIEPGAGTDPEFLERVHSKAQSFSLRAGESKTLDLKLVRVP